MGNPKAINGTNPSNANFPTPEFAGCYAADVSITLAVNQKQL